MAPTQVLLGLLGTACIVIGIMLGRRHWAGAVSLGLGIGATGYAMLSTVTKDPLGFVLDIFGSFL